MDAERLREIRKEKNAAMDEAIIWAIEHYDEHDGGWPRAACRRADGDLPLLQRRFFRMLGSGEVTLGPLLRPQLADALAS